MKSAPTNNWLQNYEDAIYQNKFWGVYKSTHFQYMSFHQFTLFQTAEDRFGKFYFLEGKEHQMWLFDFVQCYVHLEKKVVDKNKEEFDKISVLERFEYQLKASMLNTSNTLRPDFS